MSKVADETAAGSPADPRTVEALDPDDLLAPLSGVDEAPLERRPEIFERAHARLQAALAEIDGA